jgi:hypothetical protein
MRGSTPRALKAAPAAPPKRQRSRFMTSTMITFGVLALALSITVAVIGAPAFAGRPHTWRVCLSVCARVLYVAAAIASSYLFLFYLISPFKMEGGIMISAAALVYVRARKPASVRVWRCALCARALVYILVYLVGNQGTAFANVSCSHGLREGVSQWRDHTRRPRGNTTSWLSFIRMTCNKSVAEKTGAQ